MPLDPKRTVAELNDLRALTGDEDGAQRVAWTETWEQARAWLRGRVAETGAEETIDAAGNQWFTLAGKVPQTNGVAFAEREESSIRRQHGIL